MFSKKSNFTSHELKAMANTVRLLALDAVQTAGSGHPGAPLGFSDVITTIFANHLNFDPSVPNWDNRDRLILSMGHASAMLYATLHLAGYNVNRDELKKFRKIGGLPGHPEIDISRGIEMTTGPLGQGFGAAIGMAIAKPESKIYVLASDGDLMEGVSMEAASFAGFNKLKNLIVFWDNNGISIDGQVATGDDIPAKFRTMGWNTIELDGMNPKEIDKAIWLAKKMQGPTFVACKTIIGFGSVNQGTEKVHGSPLEYSDAMAVMSKLSLDFEKGSALWKKLSDSKKDESHQVQKKTKPKDLFNFNIGLDENKIYSTRELFNLIIRQCVQKNPDIIIGGSADLSVSTGSIIDSNRYIHYGVREHSMGAIMNGLALAGLYPFGGTFLTFSDYMRPSIRMAALMKLPVLFVFSHDSIALGEDGPTHQPIEQLPALRLIPNLKVYRPSDLSEIILSLQKHFNEGSNPTAIILSRQAFAKINNDLPFNNNSAVKIFASGSEIKLAIDVAKKLADKNIESSIISAYDFNFKDVSGFKVWIEASNQIPPTPFDLIFNINTFGESGKGSDVYKKFGFDADEIANIIIENIK